MEQEPDTSDATREAHTLVDPFIVMLSELPLSERDETISMCSLALNAGPMFASPDLDVLRKRMVVLVREVGLFDRFLVTALYGFLVTLYLHLADPEASAEAHEIWRKVRDDARKRLVEDDIVWAGQGLAHLPERAKEATSILNHLRSGWTKHFSGLL